MGDDFLAHVRKDTCGEWHEHFLSAHLQGTAKLVEEFAGTFKNGDWGWVAALLHDLGKGSEKFQRDIKKESGYDPHIKTLPGMKNHSTHGAIWAHDTWSHIGKILAYLIAGHHAGLPDWYNEPGVGGNLKHRLSLKERTKLPSLSPGWIERQTESLLVPQSPPCYDAEMGQEYFHLWIRMLYSALVDADFLDTERFMNEEKARQRGQYPDIVELKQRFDAYMLEFTAGKRHNTDVNRLRQQILADCRNAGSWKPGFFTLTVPTGGGKTLSSMAFALEHALAQGKTRIIMAIPYTSIIEQTAKEYKKVFGAENVIEHHSALDPISKKKETEEDIVLKHHLATENWDAPIIVTTNVQLFESLFAARSSACRKLHNLVDSVIILDEAHMLPPEYLKPILNVMQGLTRHFGVSIVLCTATQPALTGSIGMEQAEFCGIPRDAAPEIMPDPIELARHFQRVRIERAGKFEEWSELAEELRDKYKQVLCIVNTRRACRELYACMPAGTIHLSGLMCAEHRSMVIDGIKQRLKNKNPDDELRVISTQLVEAGVDIDFPVVYRAMTGFDSIAQAAGRCNREGELRDEHGELTQGRVIVFDPPQQSPTGLLRKKEDAGRDTLDILPEHCAALRPDAFERYFHLFYSACATFDAQNIAHLLFDEASDLNFQFRDAARKFRMIDNQAQVAVVVQYQGKEIHSDALIEQLRHAGPSKTLLRKLQRFTITMPERDFNQAQSCFENIHGIWCQQADGAYTEALGFVGLDIDANQFICDGG